MRLSTKSEYACLALVVLAEEWGRPHPVSIAEIAQRKEIPKKYLEQILLIMKRCGYVKSFKGAEGGYRLAKKPGEISVAEIVRLMDGALAPTESVSRYFYEKTPIERCPKLLEVFRGIRDYVSDTLEKRTFADLC